MAILSVLGLYKFNPHIFDNMVLPNSIDRDIFIDNLLSETAELEILYPDSDFMKMLIEKWSKKEKSVWIKLEETLFYEYDPICNYDRTEEWEDYGTSIGKVAAYNIEDMVNSNGFEGKSNRKGRAKGNIGVTTTQQMIDEQRKIVSFNLMNFIIDSFKKRFCILIY